MKFSQKDRKKEVIIFSLLKYLEVFITALTTFFLAKQIGPNKLGESIPIFLYITYANYLSLGVNQTIVKDLSRTDEHDKLSFLTFNIQYLALIGFINLLLAGIILDKYFILAALVSNANLFRAFFSSYYRATYRIRILNITNILYSILMLTGVLLLVNTLKEYLIVWLISLFLCLILYSFFDLNTYKRIFLNLLSLPQKNIIQFNLSEGIKLATTGIVTTILITSDRFIFNKINVSLEIKGSYQLADYVGMAVYMVFTTIIFYYTPKWIERIRNDHIFSRKYLNNCLKFYFIIPLLLLIVYIFSKLLCPIFFPEYPDLQNLIVVVLFSKISVVFVSLLSLYYVSKDKEKSYLKLMFFPILLIGLLALFILTNSSISYYLVPVLNGLIILLFTIIYFFDLMKRKI